MASQGPNSGATAANTSLGGFASWSNTGNVFASDNSYASAVTGMGADTSDGLDVTNFGFTIPSGSTINGVVVEIEEKKTGTVNSHTVQLMSAGSPIGTNQSGSEAWHASDTYLSYGSSSSLWGATLTTTTVNASTFGVRIRASLMNINDTAYVDHVRITVYYTAVYSLTVGSGSYAYTGTAVALKVGHKLTVNSGSLAYAGTAVTLTHGHPIVVEAGNYPYTGQAVTLKAPLRLVADAGNYPYAGQPVGLGKNKSLAIGPGNYPYTGRGAWPVTVDAGASGLSGVQGQFDTSRSGSGRVENDIAGYNVYVGEDTPPDLDAAPAAFSHALPVSVAVTPPGAGTKTVYVVVRKQDVYGLESRNQNGYSFVIDSTGAEAMQPLSVPQGLVLSERPGGYVRVMAVYAAFDDDDDPPSHWKVWAGATPPNITLDVPVLEQTATRVLVGTIGPFSPGTLYVAVAAYRSADMSVSTALTGQIAVSATPDRVIAVKGGYDEP